MAQGFSLADQIFNTDSIGDLAREFAGGIVGFDGDAFHTEVMGGLAERGFMERIEWIADCLEPRLSDDFAVMADQLEAAMVAPLNPDLADDDFGRFIHAVPGVLAVRHGLEDHLERALGLLYQATKRFSMEFYIRAFINRWPDQVLARLALWAKDDNYHVRRLVSEGTRPKLPWAKKLVIEAQTPVALLDQLHADDRRFVTRSVANHLNDIAKIDPRLVIKTLQHWRKLGLQNAKELDWMTRHALRTLIKKGDAEAMALLGYRQDAPVRLETLRLAQDKVVAGEALDIEVVLSADEKCPVIVDYLIWFQRKDGSQSPKVFKLKQAVVQSGKPLKVAKRHVLKGNATTFTLYAGAHRVAVQVNGKILGEVGFDLSL
ncbi:hypothetical protein NBRC116601_05970 [Cognatishimia sp. WU-CL00825]|uniref:DNA alkylation repair protein n=1 Tax=Cognatishimia sp. WU-CL00825 TaxID=3127658 RepID=UPI003109FDDE